jgi:HJR/Mrr/RecB family endonuclease
MLNICAKNNLIDTPYFWLYVITFLLVVAFLVVALIRRYRWSLYRVDKMKGHAFEEFMTTVYQTLGYKVEPTKKSGDQGIDLIIKKHFKRIGVQLKRYSRPVGNSAVQEAVAGKKFYKLDKVCVITNTSFTKSAIELAKANKVELIDREDLKILLKKAKRKAK